MATLILSCNTGEGHNSCAKAIKEYYDSVGEECVCADGLKFISNQASQFISKGHSFVYRYTPWLFKYGYSYSEEHPNVFKDGSTVYRFMTQGSERMYEYIVSGGFDTVICVHPFTAFMLTDMLNKHPMKLATCFVSTDYTCSPGTKSSNLDYYFIPDASLTKDFTNETITEDKIIPYGIPVRQMFLISQAESEAKTNAGIMQGHKHLLVMGGSMGCGPMKKLIIDIAKKMPSDWEMSIICGRNKKLFQKLDSKYSENKNVHILGFVDDMGTLMDSADLYLTKPGGASVTEAQMKNLPMVFVDAVAGCEKSNLFYFLEKGAAETGASVDEITNACLDLMHSDLSRREMKENLQAISNKDVAKTIYQTMKQLTNNNE
ncbi:MAG: glycosyltransferase [Ruminococcus sp.]|nr:glycosyltransferase [Ruminococcus sp.]